MPTLDWIGKGAVINHHREVPYHLLRCNGGLSAGNADAGNLLVQGDNLLALKALLPYYAGRVKCIYIDPPYNTGNEGWCYNDKVNSTTIRKWLGKVVGGEVEDLCRHDKWLCMMYPRLCLLRRFLADDGVFFISIDDNEQHRLRLMMDELFGGGNFLNSFAWINKREGRQIASSGAAKTYESIMAYAKDNEKVAPFHRISLDMATRLMPDAYNVRKDEILRDKIGLYIITHELYNNNSAFNEKTRPNLVFNIHYQPETREIKFSAPDSGKQYPGFVCISPKKCNDGKHRFYAWRWKREKILADSSELHFEGCNGGYRVYTKIRDFERTNLKDMITNIKSNGRMLKNLGLEFPNPKPPDLIKLLVRTSTENDSIVLDSFAGSGTTAHAVLALNKEDGGNRKFICVEMDDNICRNVAAQRIARVINGYKPNGKGERVEGLGGGFRFCTLGAPLFNAEGKIGGEVKFSDLAAHIFFCETGSPIPKRAASPLIGVYNGEAIYLLFNGILGDKRVDGGNVLTSKTLVQLPPHSGHKIVYGEGCRISESRLRREKITFRQLPYDIQTT